MSIGLPVVLKITGEHVILAGTGEAAQAKRRVLERAGAIPVAEDDPAAASARFAWVTGDDAEAVAARLKARGLLVNVADRQALCDFLMPAIVDRDPVLIAITTGGASAGLAGALRQRIEAWLPPGIGALARLLEQQRDLWRARLPDPAARRRVLDELLDLSPEAAARRIESPGETVAQCVTIRLRSPDPDDLTLREARLIGQADRLYHAADAPPAILARARADAERHIGSPNGAPGPGLTLILETAR
jgi:uroporphyrin-III C-methyltransferase / precorrin-2 dehydrogenase / sirohydrochlorin ferrochelatase